MVFYLENKKISLNLDTSESSLNPDISDDLCLPIALREGTQKCTGHPVSNFISFDNLSFSHKAFLTHLNPIEIPKTV